MSRFVCVLASAGLLSACATEPQQQIYAAPAAPKPQAAPSPFPPGMALADMTPKQRCAAYAWMMTNRYVSPAIQTLGLLRFEREGCQQ
jgi:uncharacterized lipoprotein YajG